MVFWQCAFSPFEIRRAHSLSTYWASTLHHSLVRRHVNLPTGGMDEGPEIKGPGDEECSGFLSQP